MAGTTLSAAWDNGAEAAAGTSGFPTLVACIAFHSAASRCLTASGNEAQSRPGLIQGGRRVFA